MLMDDSSYPLNERLGEHQCGQWHVCFLGQNKTAEFLRKLQQNIRTTSASGFIYNISDVVSKRTMSLHGFVRGDLECNGHKALFVIAEMTSDEGLELFGGRHVEEKVTYQ